jgi:hypothetical protein
MHRFPASIPRRLGLSGGALAVAALVLASAVPAAAWAQSGTRPQVDLACVSHGMGPLLECRVDLRRRDGTAVEGAQVMLGALMPSMPMAHTIKPMRAEPTGKPGEYRATLELQMLGVWSVDVDISGPLREKVARNLLVHECPGTQRCAATPARPGDDVHMGRHKAGGHKH